MKLSALVLRIVVIGSMVFVFSCASSGPRKEYAYTESSDEEAVEMMEEELDLEDEFETDEIAPENLKAFGLRAIEKLADFASYVEIISHKKYDRTFRKQAVRQALDLFLQDDNTIADTAILGALPYGMHDFFNYLLKNKLGQVSAELGEIEISKNLSITESGSYTGALKFTQTWIRELGKNIVSQKEIEVFLVKVDKSFGEDTQAVWEIRFGDISEVNGDQK